MFKISPVTDGLDIWAKLRELELLGEIELSEQETNLMERIYQQLNRCRNLSEFRVDSKDWQRLTRMWDKYAGG